jgi:nicotinamide phosphoribosyltransferase
LESLLVQVWYPTTVATQSREMKRIWHEYLVRTGDASLIAFKMHDFGYRGSTSDESAALGGAAHLINFTGTDNLAGCELAMRYYHAKMPGFSIPAAEHSTITAWGRERELESYANMLRAYPNSPLIAVVSDSYDIFHAVSELWGKRLHDAVMARHGTVVIRPDSGKPDEVVLSVLRRLAAAFGVRSNAKGYKLLDNHVRLIQGDGIDYHTMRTILEAMASDGWSADNLAMGSGGGLLQKVDRDTQRFAFKCSAVRIGDAWNPVSKAPITDPGKISKAGRLKLVRINGEYTTVAEDSPGPDEMVEVFRDGALLQEWTFDEVRERAAL